MLKIGKWIVPAERELIDKHVETEGHEDMTCTTLLYSYLLYILLARYITDPDDRAQQFDDIMTKLGSLETYLCSDMCPRSKQQRAFHKFATYVLRAEIYSRVDMHSMSITWADKAMELIMTDEFLGWPPYAVFFFPNFVAVLARSQSWERLQTASGRIDLYKREFHILDQLCDDVNSVLAENGVLVDAGSSLSSC